MIPALHIVAIGARTPVGLTAVSAAAAMRAGVSRIGEFPFAVGPSGDLLRCGHDARLPPTLPCTERMTVMARHAIAEAALAVAGSARDTPHVTVHLGFPLDRPGFHAADAQHVAHAIVGDGIAGMVVDQVHWSLGGHTGVLQALHTATAAIARSASIHLICGVDSHLDDQWLDRLDTGRRLQREGVRDGFIPGEAAGVVVVASDAVRTRRGLPSLARVRAVAVATESRSPTSPVGLLGEGLTQAVSRACADLRGPGEHVSDVYCDINGERHRADEWGFTLLRKAELFRDGTDYRTAVDSCGDVGAASGALGCVLAVQAWRRRYARGPLALVWGASLAGLRGALLLEKPPEE